jgi:hypothetical protein
VCGLPDDSNTDEQDVLSDRNIAASSHPKESADSY